MRQRLRVQPVMRGRKRVEGALCPAMTTRVTCSRQTQNLGGGARRGAASRRLGMGIKPSRWASFLAALRARRMASAFSRVLRSDGFSYALRRFISRKTPSRCIFFLSTRRAWSTLLSRTITCKKHSFRVQVERIERIKVAATTCHFRTGLKRHSARLACHQARLELRSSYPSDVRAPARNDTVLATDFRTSRAPESKRNHSALLLQPRLRAPGVRPAVT